ncbi:MAG: hypothetical protein HYV97_19715 [Bdellovibrio sp.]|nr:hypothetical protein [Bdellovibrio sp.]
MKIALAIFFLLMLSCTHQVPNPPKEERPVLAVQIEIKKEYLETVYSAQENECRVSVTTHFPESVNKDVARLRHNRCNEISIAKMLQEILLKISSAYQGGLPFKSFSMGRLQEYPAFSKQLMAFAANSKNWNDKKGLPIKGHLNNFVTEALNELLPSMWMVKILSPYWKSIKISGVEKVLVDPVAKLPFDCQFWITPLF